MKSVDTILTMDSNSLWTSCDTKALDIVWKNIRVQFSP